jgi:aminopeptidase N
MGDPLTPDSGNGGYDVAHYDLKYTVAADGTVEQATTTVQARATQALSTFNLDFIGYEVDAVTVGKTSATFTRDGAELVVTPKDRIRNGKAFTVAVTFHGSPPSIRDFTGPFSVGWIHKPSGSFIAAEPAGAKGVFPGNDHPADKATYTITVTAPSGLTVAANGVRTAKVANGATTTWTYNMAQPMASYLLQIAVGQYDEVTATGPHGLPIRNFVISTLSADKRAYMDDTAKQLEFFESFFGPYPFDTYGMLVADSPRTFALETQSLTLMPAGWFDESHEYLSSVASHELAHAWFGDDVSPATWSDVWLNESFATYAQWLWDDHQGALSLQTLVDTAMAQLPSLRKQNGAVAAPSAEDLFSSNVYEGGAVALEALRRTVGEEAFFNIVRTWIHDHAGSSATTAQFETLASQVSGTDLTGFFHEWIHSTTTPTMPAKPAQPK